MKRKPVYTIGSISSGTMLNEDLIPSFLSEFQYLVEKNGIKGEKRFINRINKAMDDEEYFDSDEAQYDIDELFNKLDELAAPYFYFGAHPGNGADYGFWLSEMMQEDFDGLKVEDLSEVPKDYRGEVLEVNDHGNMTLWIKNSKGFKEVWAIV
jgi:hypothetical protein